MFAKIFRICKTLSSYRTKTAVFGPSVLLTVLNIVDTPVLRNLSTIGKDNSIMSGSLSRALEEATWGMVIGDAVAMPVHWYYNPDDIKRGYDGWLTGYRAPNKRHPSSILSLSAVDGSGRHGWGKTSKPLIGHVILHDKLQYWKGGASVHYHQGMKAGDSTLNSIVAQEFLKTMSRVDADRKMTDTDLQAEVFESYVKLMTTPGCHNDTYAESFHRAFFRDWASLDNPPRSGKDILKFAQERSVEMLRGPEDHQLPVIGALVPAIPWILHRFQQSEDQCVKSTLDFIRLTHPVQSLFPFVEAYARLLHRVINGRNLKTEVEKALQDETIGGKRTYQSVLKLKDNAEKYVKDSEQQLRAHQQGVGRLGLACYIDGSMIAMLYLALSFHDDFENGVLTNANCGGENCHRGAALGALLGAAVGAKGQRVPQRWKDGLGTSRDRLSQLFSVINDR